MNQSSTLPLSLYFVQDADSNRFTAFFAQFSEVFAEGRTKEEAEINLLKTIETVFEFKSEELTKNSFPSNTDVERRNFKLELA